MFAEVIAPGHEYRHEPDGTPAYEFSLGDGRRGLGIIEVLDQLADGRPISMGH